MKILAALALAAMAGTASAAVVFTESFDSGTGSFTVQDLAGTGKALWKSMGDYGYSNWTGGSGNAATASSDFASGEFDTRMVSPGIAIGAGPASVSFNYNYQNFALLDVFAVEISTDGGGSWSTLWSTQADTGGFQALPGASQTIDISAYGGNTVNIGFHYYDPNTGDWDWYVQVDDVVVDAVPAPGAAALLGLGGLLVSRRRR
ncbi:MAG: choice-of-anchor J domain-containing protein [Phycisphaerales bacterium]|jgi:MYXO-CTERM domain-containing protein|nr:choice-of-anchor J domain-containing protein [Phycisphaerales bacterium]